MKRAQFVGSSAALIAAAFLRDVSFAADIDAATPELATLVETLLPFGAAAFPAISSAAVVQRLDVLFKLSESPVFQASLRAFSSPAQFSIPHDELAAAERAISPGADIHELVRRDASAFAAAALPAAAAFQDLGPEQRNAYVRLWSQSAFGTRRRFYGSVRSVTFVAFYSLPKVWAAIGYAGPMLEDSKA